MPELKRYHEISGVIHIGCEDPAAYFIPFEDEKKSSTERENSSFFTSLCGEWKFSYFDNSARVEIESPSFPSSVRMMDCINVPGNWQLNLGKGYDVPNYINQDYPFPVDPPFIPDIVPCGLYRKYINFSVKSDKKYYLHFEGVSSCFYLWINNSFAAYSQVSHSTTVVDISDFIKSGENIIDVLVVKHCDGSYFEDQDFFRLSGIFREVYILERDNIHIEDIYVITDVSSDFDYADISAEIKGVKSVEYKLISPKGNKVFSGNGKIKFRIDKPLLWNYEDPALYTLILHCGNEYISIPVGFKRFEIVNSCVYLNGQKIKAKGINRHDSNPETGYWVTPKQMLSELYLLKRANVNTIRTSHYPNDPRFYEMCDRLGFMVVDEADLETHGMGYNFGDWYWDYWAHLTDSPAYKEACVDRARLLFERDKNHVCVIMWSLGNESGCGKNHRSMAEYIRSRNKNAFIHYENAHLEYQARLGKDFSDISDVESRMYASTEYLENYLSDDTKDKPFFYCEYVDSMSTGEIEKHWKNFEDNDKYFGGCVWEFCDHAVNIGTKEKPQYRYGGDFGDWPNDNICCVDGLVHPNRSPRPGYYDMKKVYEPFSVTYKDGKISVFNKRFFTDFSDIYLEWTIERNGYVILNGLIENLLINPRGYEEYDLFSNNIFDELTTLNIYFKQKNNTLWAEKGFCIGFSQFILSNERITYETENVGVINYIETRTDFEIKCGNIKYLFDRITGVVSKIEIDNECITDGPISFNMWRAANYNVRNLIDNWKRARYDRIKQKTYETYVNKIGDAVIIVAKISLASAAMPPAVKATVKYTFSPDGSLTIKAEAKVTKNAPPLPRFGIQIVLHDDFQNVKYLGYGPQESYSDRYKSARLSLYDTTSFNDYEHYVKPQECSSHYNTFFASISNGNKILEFTSPVSKPYCFKAIPYNDVTIHDTAHDDELPETGKTYVNLDYKILASNQVQQGICPEREFDEKEFSFGINIIPKKIK